MQLKKIICGIVIATSCNVAMADDAITRPTGVGFAVDYIKKAIPTRLGTAFLHAQNIIGFRGGIKKNADENQCVTKHEEENTPSVDDVVTKQQDSAKSTSDQSEKQHLSALRSRLTTTFEAQSPKEDNQSYAPNIGINLPAGEKKGYCIINMHASPSQTTPKT